MKKFADLRFICIFLFTNYCKLRAILQLYRVVVYLNTSLLAVRNTQAYIKKGVHQFSFVLPTMRTPDIIGVCSCIYNKAEIIKRMSICIFIELTPMHTPRCDDVRIGSHFHTNAYMHEQTTIGIHKEEVPRLVYNPFLL